MGFYVPVSGLSWPGVRGGCLTGGPWPPLGLRWWVHHPVFTVAMSAHTSVPTERGAISSFQGSHIFITPILSLFPERGPCSKVGLSLSFSVFLSDCLIMPPPLGPSPLRELRRPASSLQPVSWEFQSIGARGQVSLLAAGRPFLRQLPARALLPVYF